MNDDISNADLFKKLDEMNVPVERCTVYSRYDELGLRDDTLPDHHADIAKFQLSAEVPKDVVIQYETAKNIYLYAWYVYRFYPVAEQQALSCLEMGLRNRLPNSLPPGYGRNDKPNSRPTMAPLLRYAIDQGLIKNEGFTRWHRLVRQRAQQRILFEQIEEMQMTDATGQEINIDEIVPNEQDLDCDFVSVLEKTLPGIRNAYAHGSTRLNKQVLGTFELVKEILAQLYPASELMATDKVYNEISD